MDNKKKKCIFVLGMHRSGTSALTGVLQILGADLGKNIIKIKGEGNEKGFFENQSVYDVNEEILRKLDSFWDNPFPLPEKWWEDSSLKVYKDKIKEIILNEFDGQLIAIKDPRMCKLFPLWKKILEDMDIDYCCIIPLRSPFEVAGSLMKRDGFSLEKSALLWITHTFDSELYSRDCPRVFISFDGLLRKTGEVIADFINKLNLNFPKLLIDSITDIEEFLSPQLKHYNIQTGEIENVILKDIIDWYQILSGLTSKEKVELKEIQKIDDFRKRFIQVYNFFFNYDVIRRYKQIDHLLAERDQRIAERDQRIAERDQEITKKDIKIEIMNQEMNIGAQQIIERDKLIKSLTSSHEYKIGNFILLLVKLKFISLVKLVVKSIKFRTTLMRE